MGIGRQKDIRNYSKSVKGLAAQANERKPEIAEMAHSVKKNIEEAKIAGIACDTAEKILIAGQKRLDSAKTMDDYNAARDLIESADKTLKRLKLQYKKSSQLLTSINKRYSEIEKQGISINNIDELIAKAKTAMDANNYGDAIQISTDILSYIDETVQVFMLASDLIAQAEAKINIARSFEAETGEAEDFLNDAKEQMEAKDYTRAHKLAQESIKVSENVKNEQIGKFKQQAEGQLKELENEIFELKKLGAESGKPEFILKKIKAAMKHNDFKAAFDYYGNFKAAAAEATERHKKALTKLDSAKQVIIEAQKSGGDVAKAKQNYMNAEIALKNHDYDAATLFIETAIKFADRALEEHRRLMSDQDKAEALLGTAKSSIDEARNSGIILIPVMELLEKGEEALMGSNYEFAQKMGNQIIERVKELQELHAEASEIIPKAENSITESKSFVDTAEAEKFLTKALESNDAGNYSEAVDYAKKVIENIDYIKANDKPDLKLDCDDIPGFKTGMWAKCNLEFFNQGKVHARDINFTLSDRFESRGISSLPNLAAGERKVIELELRTSEVGDMFVDVSISFTNPITEETIKTKEIIWLKTER